MVEQLRFMAVHAHPDDESSKGAATMAKYVAEGVDVLVATCTGGERGSVLNPKLDRPEIWADIAEIRRREMDRAREILGIRQAWLGWVDSGLPDGYLEADPKPDLPEGCFGVMDVEEAAKPLIKLIREFRPHVITTYGEDGGYPHPDHIMCHKISVAAFDAAGDAVRYPELGEAWQTMKLYYNMSWSRARLTTIHEGMLAAGLESPFAEWLEKSEDRDEKGGRITTKVNCGDYFPVRDEALRAHATQVDPDGFWFRIPMEIQQKLWPYEEYQLAHSTVGPIGEEDDLFDGVSVGVA